MKFLRIVALILVSWSAGTCCFGMVAPQKKTAKTPRAQRAAKTAKTDPRFVPVDALIRQVVNSEGVTGAVLLVGHNGKIVHEQAFGLRSLSPRAEPMTTDTIFDLASLTKVVATTPSVMRLVEYGQVRLSDPVSKFIPEFG